MYLLVHKSTQNNLIKDEFEGSLDVGFGATQMFFQRALKTEQKGEEKDPFDAVVDGSLEGAIEGALEGAPNDALNDLRKEALEANVTIKSKQNIVKVLNFQLLLIIFNLSMTQIISRGAVG